MTWNETHTRTAIIREVEAASALDMTGALPWREEWAPYFGSPEGLLKALRSRWNRMCEAQLDISTGEDVFGTPRPAPPHPGRHPRDPAQGQRDPGRAGAKVLALTGARGGAGPAQGAGAGSGSGRSSSDDDHLRNGHRAMPRRRLDRLSRRELEVLRLIARRPVQRGDRS